MKVLLPFLLACTLCVVQAVQPVTHQDELPSGACKPWVSSQTSDYSGIYDSLETDGSGTARVVLTFFHKGEPQISACMITTEDLAEKPRYQITTLPVDGKTGQLGEWKMIRYTDPNTRATVFGLQIDGQIFVDRSKTQKK